MATPTFSTVDRDDYGTNKSVSSARAGEMNVRDEASVEKTFDLLIAEFSTISIVYVTVLNEFRWFPMDGTQFEFVFDYRREVAGSPIEVDIKITLDPGGGDEVSGTFVSGTDGPGISTVYQEGSISLATGGNRGQWTLVKVEMKQVSSSIWLKYIEADGHISWTHRG